MKYFRSIMVLAWGAVLLGPGAESSAGQASRMPSQGSNRKPPYYMGPYGLVLPGGRVPDPSNPSPPSPAVPDPGPGGSSTTGPTAGPAPRTARSPVSGGFFRHARRSSASTRITARWEVWWEWNKERYLATGKRPRCCDSRAGASSLFPGLVSPEATRESEKFRRVRSEILLPALRKNAAHSRTALRVASAYALGFIADREVMPDLIRALSDPDIEVRETAVTALGMTGDTRAVPALLEVVKGRLPGAGDAKKRRATIRTRGLAALGLGLLGDADVLGVLKRTAWNTNTPREVRGAALLAVGLIPDAESREILSRVLRASWCGTTERALVATALGFQGDPAVLDPLHRLLRDRASEVRRSAVLALGAFPRQAVLLENLRNARARLNASGDEDLSDFARDVLVTYIEKVRTRVERERAAEAAVWKRLRTVLRHLTRDADHAVRAFASVSLGQVGEIQDAEAVGRGLVHGSHEVKGFAALGLGILARNHPKKAGPLIGLLRKHLAGTRDPGLRGALFLSLGLAADREVRRELTASFGRDTAPSLRGYAATALGLLGDRSAAHRVAMELARAKDLEEIQNSALGLALIGGEDEVRYLKTLLFASKDTREQIAVGTGLAFMGGRDVLGILVKFLSASTRPTAARAFVTEGIGIASDLRDPTPLSRITSGQNFLLRIGPVDRVVDLKW